MAIFGLFPVSVLTNCVLLLPVVLPVLSGVTHPISERSDGALHVHFLQFLLRVTQRMTNEMACHLHLD